MTNKVTGFNTSSRVSADRDALNPAMSLDRPRYATIADAPALARDLVTQGFADSHSDSGRFDQLAQSDPGFLRRLFATAEQKCAWEKQNLRTNMVGQSRLARIKMISETEVRILATTSEALVKATEIYVARRFYGNAQAEVNAMAVASETSRKVFMAHVEERERTLQTLPPRLKARYEASIEREVDNFMAWFDEATADLLTKLKDKVVTYAGSIDG
jgi:hypothetical protein